MKLVKKSTAQSFSNGPTCSGIAYPLGDDAIDIALVTVNGRYPEKDYVMNEVCKEVGYVLRGSGRIWIAGQEPQMVEPGDTIIVQPGEKFFWQGENLEMLMPCTPAFNPAQHRQVK